MKLASEATRSNAFMSKSVVCQRIWTSRAEGAMGCASSSEQTVRNSSSAGEPTRGLPASVLKAPSASIPRLAVAESTSVTQNLQSAAIVGDQKCCFGAGCYWGTEKYMKSDFAKKSQQIGAITSGKVGFMGPSQARANPSYSEVCSGKTGHVEVLEVCYSGGDAYFEAMVRFFFQFHDPTTLNAQGNDKGTQYASVIFCDTESQVAIAERVKGELQGLIENGALVCFHGDLVTTKITRYTTFYPAHQEHQEYLAKNPNGYCNHRLRFAEWP